MPAVFSEGGTAKHTGDIALTLPIVQEPQHTSNLEVEGHCILKGLVGMCTGACHIRCAQGHRPYPYTIDQMP